MKLDLKNLLISKNLPNRIQRIKRLLFNKFKINLQDNLTGDTNKLEELEIIIVYRKL